MPKLGNAQLFFPSLFWLWRVVFRHKVFELRQAFGAAQSINVPDEPGPITLLGLEARGSAFHVDGDFARCQVPEPFGVKAKLDVDAEDIKPALSTASAGGSLEFPTFFSSVARSMAFLIGSRKSSMP